MGIKRDLSGTPALRRRARDGRCGRRTSGGHRYHRTRV